MIPDYLKPKNISRVPVAPAKAKAPAPEEKSLLDVAREKMGKAKSAPASSSSPAPAAVKTHKVIFQSSPKRCEVRAGNQVATTPAVIYLPDDAPSTAVFSKPGYIPATVDVPVDQRIVLAKLEKEGEKKAPVAPAQEEAPVQEAPKKAPAKKAKK